MSKPLASSPPPLWRSFGTSVVFRHRLLPVFASSANANLVVAPYTVPSARLTPLGPMSCEP